MTINIELRPDEERALLERARLSGRDPVQYAQQIIRDHIGTPAHETTPEEATGAKPTLEDFIDHEFIAYCDREGDESVTLEEVLEASLSTWETVKNTGFLRKTVVENYGRRSQIAKNLGKSAILAC